jgi:LPXTG-motif cell wall-anchored protein
MYMDATNTQALLVLGVVVILALIALAAYFFYRRRQSRLLEERFGSEYGRAVKELGSRAKAEAELKRRQERVEGLRIVPLAPGEAARFSKAWNSLQAEFVDNPTGAVAQAEELVRELMLKRGYPMGDFEHRAADISVDHPAVVSNYRAAQDIRSRNLRGEVDTEELRKAVVHYRALFDDLLEVRQQAEQERMPARPVEARS